MRCPGCSHDNPEGSRFCNGCGASLSVPTSDRLESLRAFIPGEVAEKLRGAGGAGERRTVTALFCDVVGSTALGERLGPERFKVVMDQLLGRLITAVCRYEGTIAQVMGDGLLAFFGAPLAHEDDPERAFNAALDIRKSIGDYARDLEAAYAVSIAVRVGLHTGPVALSHVTDVLQVTYNALGDTVTTAARLQAAAAPGTILASETTARLVVPLFDLRPLDPLQLKGKTAPVAAVEVLAARADAGKPRGIAGLSSPLVGRHREVEALMRSVQAVTEGRGQIVALLGEAGLGKSRLMAEVRKAAPQVRWLEGRSLSYAGGIPYFPFLDLLREWLGVTSADPEAKVRIELRAALDSVFGGRAADVYPYFGALLRIALEPEAAARIADLSAESLQHQAFLVLREWAAQVAAQQPLALILDDLHWADPTSLVLLEAVLEVTEEAAVLLCLVFRPERGHGCWQLNEVARRRFPHRHAEIALQPLSPSDTEQLVGNLLTLADFPVEVRELIIQKAEGNPFFIEEVIRELIEARVLVRDGDRWRAPQSISSLEIPDSVQGVLLSRMDRLPAEAKRVLQAASVIGRLFPLGILREVVGGNGHLQTALGDLQRHELIIERRRLPQAEYRFTHALTQEVAYSTLLEGESRRLHRAVAQALEAAYADRLEEVYGLLAYHYDRSEDEVRAVQFLVRAGDKARAEYADDEALRSYARAVEIMKRRGESRAAAETLMKAALAHHIAFDFRAADQAYREAFAILERLPQAEAPGLKPATLRMAMPEPAGVDSTLVSDVPSGILKNQLFECPLAYGPGMNVVPALARSWEISADGTGYRLHLHRHRQWSDGRPVTAHDFVFTWLRNLRGLNAPRFHDIAGSRRYTEGHTDDPASVGLRALDDYTLEILLEGPRAYFPFVLASGTWPHPRWIIEKDGEEWTTPEHLVTNGPYVLAEWQRGSHIKLRANPRYTGPSRGNVNEVHLIFKSFRDPSIFEAGEVDVLWFNVRDPDSFARFRNVLHPEAPLRSACMFFRCDRPPFNDRRLRLAFAHATDRAALARSGGPYVLPADGGLVPPPIPGHSPQIALFFDPERARRLLAEAGYPGGRGLGPFVIPIPEGWVDVISEIPLQSWREILGVDVTIVPMPTAEYWRQQWTDPVKLGRFAWFPDIPDPDDFLRGVFHSTSPHNPSRWCNERFDAMVDEAQLCTDNRKRMALYHEADRLLVAEEAAIIPTVYARRAALVHPRVKGWWSDIGHLSLSELIVEETR